MIDVDVGAAHTPTIHQPELGHVARRRADLKSGRQVEDGVETVWLCDLVSAVRVDQVRSNPQLTGREVVRAPRISDEDGLLSRDRARVKSHLVARRGRLSVAVTHQTTHGL